MLFRPSGWLAADEPKGLTGHGRGASCPRSQDGGKDKTFGLWLFPAKDINDKMSLAE